MRARRFLAMAAFAFAVTASCPAGAVEVDLAVADSANVARQGEPVTTGVPFAKGAVKDVAALSVSVGGKPIPAQFLKLVPWPDGSVRWALMDCQVDMPAGGRAALKVSDKGVNPAPAAPVKVEDGADAVKVSTGPLEFTVNKKKFNVFESLKVDGKELVTSAGKGVVMYSAAGGETLAGVPTEVKLEQTGPMRAIICIRGKFPAHNDLLSYTVRITAYAGKKCVKIQTWLENYGAYGYGHTNVKPEWFGFKGLAVELGLGLGEDAAAECEGAKGVGRFKVEQRCPGANWKGFAYAVTEGDKEIKKGDRTDGVVALAGGNGKLTVAIRHFWENYEKAIELDGKTLKLWLWPSDGEWPRPVKGGPHSGGLFAEYKKPGIFHLPGSTHKGYEAILDFSGQQPKAGSAMVNAPLLAQATPAYYASTEAAPGWFAPADFVSGKADYDGKVKNWNQCVRNGIDPDPGNKFSLLFARNGGGDERGSWYGWMDFGDNLWACGPSSLHYDWTWIMLLNFLRQGDRGFFDMGETMAHHRIDVDQRWSDRDELPYRALTAYEKGFTDIHLGAPGGERPTTSHNWISGVVLYYMLTGEPKAYECCMRNYQGIKERQVDPRRNSTTADGQTRSASWSILALCSLNDLTADRKYLDDAMVLFNNEIVPKWKKVGPFLDTAALQYYYSTQPLVELAEHTGDENVLKLLKEGCEKDFATAGLKDMYSEWPIFLSNIYAYVGYKTKNDAYVKKAEALFCAYVPASPSPFCYGPTSQAWDKESGKMIRNGHILQYVEWKLKP